MPKLNDWVWIEAMVIQAMVGAVSNNFRQVTLSYIDEHWVLGFVLAKECENDRNEIEFILDQAENFITDIESVFLSRGARKKLLSRVEINGEALTLVNDTENRILFRRKEV